MSKNPLEVSVPAQEMGMAEETHLQAFCDQANCVAANQEVNNFQATVVPDPGLAALSAEGPAAHEECGPPAVAPMAFLELPMVTAKGQQSDSFVEDVSTQDLKLVSVDAKVSGEASEVGALHADGLSALPKTSLDGVMNLCSEEGEDKIYENKTCDKNAPVILLSKSFQSKGNDDYEATPLTTCHPSGWFTLHENQTHVPFVHLLLFYTV
ncbi:hypothetical protein ATANTOWER_001150 [Ataeniobius toweri]|uniref:Uncharacterized protein n=1 Tax=Ataeniobius toweri TaxID=208326 RepID=A0ABU7ADA2_9TELE|nr:hypothetical protein [Ataeniobius toweri]